MMNENEIMHSLGEIESSLKSAHKRIDSVEKLTESVYKLATSIEAMQHDLTDMSKRIDKIEEKPVLPPCQHIKDFERFDSLEKEVAALKEKPAKRWDKLIGSVISSLTGGIIGYILAVILK